MRRGSGAHLFVFYHDFIKFRRNSGQPRCVSAISISSTSQAERIIAFQRTSTDEDLLIFATTNTPDRNGYWVYAPNLPDAAWPELFIGGSSRYGGDNTGDSGGQVSSHSGYIGPVVPANGFFILKRV